MFDEKLIEEARYMFPSVFVRDEYVRIFPTDWFFETEDYLHSNEELKAYIDEEKRARAFEDKMLDGMMWDNAYEEYL